ncbi:hypothetical protein [Pontibacillus sp. HMF3514]|uniref:hypothetical protein n=1 Tax=Pontibacillus sp. HMF3514 TaxID=2692425 RepID=UPI00131F54EE|nr:hypothetical protein [Pontibacillus sp. HMF3514]QHE52357.1 hypothetical protein GS400_10040 [Pontibacillus sp. HMF3514]
MKKIIVSSLALGLIISNGVTGVYAQSLSNNADNMSPQTQMRMDSMQTHHQIMQDINGPINYGQVKKIMNQIHPQITNKEIKDMYNSMHGTNGSEQSANFTHMHKK